MYRFPDFTPLILLGIGALVVLAVLVPIGGLWCMAWLLEPRIGEVAWVGWLWASIAWALVTLAFFGTAFFGRR